MDFKKILGKVADKIEELYHSILENNEFNDDPVKIKHQIRSVLNTLNKSGQIIRIKQKTYKKSELFKEPKTYKRQNHSKDKPL